MVMSMRSSARLSVPDSVIFVPAMKFTSARAPIIVLSTLTVSVWELTALAFHVAGTTPSGSSTEAYALIAEVETGPDSEVVIRQRHRGVLSLPGTVAVAIPV